MIASVLWHSWPLTGWFVVRTDTMGRMMAGLLAAAAFVTACAVGPVAAEDDADAATVPATATIREETLTTMPISEKQPQSTATAHQEPEVRHSYSWNSGVRNLAQRRYFFMAPPAVGATVGFERNQDERIAAGVKSTDKSQSMVERLELATKGFVYHPALLQYKLQFSPEFRQTKQLASEITGASSVNGNSFNPNYQAHAVILGRKPYALTAFAQHLEAQSWSAYTGLLQTKSDNYGADLALKYRPLPTTIGFSSSKSNQDGYWVTSTTWREAHLYARHRGGSGDSNFTATYGNTDQVTNGQAHEISTANGTFSNQYTFTDDGRIGLVSTLQYLYQDAGTLQNNSLVLNEHLSWRHLKNLESRHAFSYRQFDTATTSNRLSSIDSRMVHRLYENLTTTAGAGGSHNAYTDGSEKTLHGLIDFAYQRALGKWGNLQLHAGISDLYSFRTGQAGEQQVTNETHTLLTSTETFLGYANVIIDSVLVTNSAGTIIYTKDIDYQLDLIGSSLRISRLPLGAIAEGQVVLVSYRYSRDAAYDDSLLSQNYDMQLNIKGALFLKYRYMQARQTLIAGPEPDRLSNASSHLASVRYDIDWSETGVVFEDTTSSSDVSYQRWELNQSLRLHYSSWLQYVLRGYIGETSYRTRDDDRKNRGLTTTFSWLPFTWLKCELDGYLEDVNGTLEKTTNSGAKASIVSSYRLWTARLSFKYADQYNRLSDYRRRTNQIQFELIRTVW